MFCLRKLVEKYLRTRNNSCLYIIDYKGHSVVIHSNINEIPVNVVGACHLDKISFVYAVLVCNYTLEFVISNVGCFEHILMTVL